jgi:hypothetical protein
MDGVIGNESWYHRFGNLNKDITVQQQAGGHMSGIVGVD